MTNAIEEAAVLQFPQAPHDLKPVGFRKWVPPAMPVKPVDAEQVIPKSASGSSEISTKKRPLVYLAGPYTLGNTERNVRCQQQIANDLLNDGVVVPYSPLAHSDGLEEMQSRPYEAWMDHSFAMLSRCDAVYRHAATEDGYYQYDSSGAEREVEYAKTIGIPVFYNELDLSDWAEELQAVAIKPDPATEGATRSKDADDVRFDLIPQLALQDIARVLAKGAASYGEHNYRKGSRFSHVANRALRHLNLYLRGDKSEKHLSHAACNLLFLLEYEHIHPELNDLLTAEDYLPKETHRS